MGILARLCNSQLGLHCPPCRRHQSLSTAPLHKGTHHPCSDPDLKVQQFYSLRVGLGIISAVSETVLVHYVQSYKSVSMGKSLLCLLCLSAGMFVASTGTLPHLNMLISIA